MSNLREDGKSKKRFYAQWGALFLCGMVLSLFYGWLWYWWWQYPFTNQLSIRGPLQGDQKNIKERPESIFPGKYQQIHPFPSVLQKGGEWIQFRGQDRSNRIQWKKPLRTQWVKGSPPIRWKKSLGDGYASPVIWGNHGYILDYDPQQQRDVLRCFSLETGEDRWIRSYFVPVKRNHGYSRTVPVVVDGVVISMGPKCHVFACDAKTGEFLWGLDLVKEFGTEVPLWYAGQCMLAWKDAVIIAPAGRSILMFCAEARTGKIVWSVPNDHLNIKMSHSSIMPCWVDGQPIFVYLGIGGMVWVNESGKLLGSSREWTHSVIVPSPVDVGENRIFVTAGYGKGSALFQFEKDSEATYTLKRLQSWSAKEFASEQQTPVLFSKDLLLTVLPKDGGPFRESLVALDLRTYTIRWRLESEFQFGLGPYLLIDDTLWILDDYGILTVVRIFPEKAQILFRDQVLQGIDSWAPLVFVDGYLLLRDLTTMIALDLKEPGESLP